MKDELTRVLGHYSLGELRTARRAEHGFVNDNWIVETERGRYFLKRRHPSLRRPARIRAQHQLIAWLRQAGFPAPTIVRSVSGETLVTMNGELYEIQGFIEGEPYDPHRAQHFDQAARTLGRYHACVHGFAPETLCRQGQLYSPKISNDILARLRQAWQLDQDPTLAQTAHQLAAYTSELAARFAGHGQLHTLVIHGDYYAGNLLFRGDRIVGVVDYDKANWQPRIAELAETLIYFASPCPGHLEHLVYPGFLEWEPFVRFLRGYVSVTQRAHTVTLRESEVHALPDYIACIWLSMSLRRLLEQEPRRPPYAAQALQEALALADWASANAVRMTEVARSATSSHQLPGALAPYQEFP
jgi:homoserine kinase type II